MNTAGDDSPTKKQGVWINDFEEALTGGHPNSLGRTLEVTEQVLANRNLLGSLLDCYNAGDPVVRLRVSNCLKRVCIAEPDWVHAEYPRIATEIAKIDQASTKWTVSIVFGLLRSRLTTDEKATAVSIMKENLGYQDWIVQNTTMQQLYDFSEDDLGLELWLLSQLELLRSSPWKSVSGRAVKLLKAIEKRSLGRDCP